MVTMQSALNGGRVAMSKVPVRLFCHNLVIAYYSQPVKNIDPIATTNFPLRRQLVHFLAWVPPYSGAFLKVRHVFSIISKHGKRQLLCCISSLGARRGCSSDDTVDEGVNILLDVSSLARATNMTKMSVSEAASDVFLPDSSIYKAVLTIRLCSPESACLAHNPTS